LGRRRRRGVATLDDPGHCALATRRSMLTWCTRASVQRGRRPGCACSGPRARGATAVRRQSLVNTDSRTPAPRRLGMGPAPAHPNRLPCHLWRRACRRTTGRGAGRWWCPWAQAPCQVATDWARGAGGEATARCAPGCCPWRWVGEHGYRRRPAAPKACTPTLSRMTRQPIDEVPNPHPDPNPNPKPQELPTNRLRQPRRNGRKEEQQQDAHKLQPDEGQHAQVDVPRGHAGRRHAAQEEQCPAKRRREE
jgi:hypothetical protein